MKTYLTVVITSVALVLSSAVLACPCNRTPGDQAQATQADTQSNLNLDAIKASATKTDQDSNDPQSLLLNQ